MHKTEYWEWQETGMEHESSVYGYIQFYVKEALILKKFEEEKSSSTIEGQMKTYDF